MRKLITPAALAGALLVAGPGVAHEYVPSVFAAHGCESGEPATWEIMSMSASKVAVKTDGKGLSFHELMQIAEEACGHFDGRWAHYSSYTSLGSHRGGVHRFSCGGRPSAWACQHSRGADPVSFREYCVKEYPNIDVPAHQSEPKAHLIDDYE